LDDQVDLTKWYTGELFHSDKTFQSKYDIPRDVKIILSSLEKRAALNKKIKIKKTSYSQKEFSKFTHAILNEVQNQGNYLTKKFQLKDEEIIKLQQDFEKKIKQEKKLTEYYKTKRYENPKPPKKNTMSAQNGQKI